MYMVDGAHDKEKSLEGLLVAAKAGDEEAFRTLYESLVDRLFGYVQSRVGYDTDPADVVQDVFIDLWASLPRLEYRSPGHFYAFVFTIVKRKLYAHYRTHQPTERIDDIASDDHPRVDAVLHDPDGMRELVAALPERYRDVMTLRYWSGMSFADIADMLGTTESNIKVRHHRALKRLQRRMDTL